MQFLVEYRLKARTHRPILTGSAVKLAVESANSNRESADFTTHSGIIIRLSLLSMFNILDPMESTDGSRPTIGVGQREIGLVGTGL